MTTTHSAIKQKYQEEVKWYQHRTIELQEVGQKLLKSYRESLSLPSDFWQDKNGVPRPYVSSGFMNEKGFFQQKNISSLSLDHDLKLRFIISTVIDESAEVAIPHSDVSISIYKKGDSFYFDVGEQKDIRVFQPDAIDAFEKVIYHIKETVISGFTYQRSNW